MIQNIISAQIINIPDTNFKDYLIHASEPGYYSVAGVGSVNFNQPASYVGIDTNHDNQIDQSEAQAITYLNLASPTPQHQIMDLTGLEYFTNLISFSCQGHLNLNTMNLTGLTNLVYLGIDHTNMGNINLSNLINLQFLDCSYSNRLFINLSNFTQLKYFKCSNNIIWQLNFYNLPNLQLVNCSDNKLYTLDFTNAPMLNDLSCKNNPNLTTIKIKNGIQHLPRTSQNFQECIDRKSVV